MRTIWIFGPQGSGKTAIAQRVTDLLRQRGKAVAMIDGDDLRKTVSRDLGFSYDDRMKQTTRAAFLANACNLSGTWAIVSLVTPYPEFRALVAGLIPGVEMVYIRTDAETRSAWKPEILTYDCAFEEPKETEPCYTVPNGVGANMTVLAANILADVEEGLFDNGAGI
jgi:adenylylsulfate kinase